MWAELKGKSSLARPVGIEALAPPVTQQGWAFGKNMLESQAFCFLEDQPRIWMVVGSTCERGF